METIETAPDLLATAGEHGLRLRCELELTGADLVVLHAVDEEGVPWVVRSPLEADFLVEPLTKY